MSQEQNPERPFQFSLRQMFVGITVVAIIIGGLAQFERMRSEALKDAVRQAIKAGRIPPENYRDMLGDEVDQLAPAHEKPN